MRRALVFVLFLGVCLACAGGPSPPEPEWLQKLRAREAATFPTETIQSQDRFFRARVAAKLAGTIDREGDAYSLSLDIGTVAPVDCWVYREGLDFGASLSGMSEQSFGAIAQMLGPIELRRIDRVDAGVLDEDPFLAVDWMYRVKTRNGPQVGQIKHLITSKRGRAVYCQHNEVGYAASFRRAVTALRESLEYREPYGSAPYFSEVSTMTVKGMRVGVTHTLLTRDDQGDTRIDTRTSMLVPLSGTELQVSDTFEVEFARADGTLINQLHVVSADGEIVSNLELNPQPEGVWKVEGTFQGKKLAKTLTPASPPSSWLGDALALRELLAAGGAELTMTRWLPDADPTRLLDGTISIEEPVDAQRFAAKLDAAGLEAELVVDRRGTVSSGSVEMGVVKVDIERVYAGGAF